MFDDEFVDGAFAKRGGRPLPELPPPPPPLLDGPDELIEFDLLLLLLQLDDDDDWDMERETVGVGWILNNDDVFLLPLDDCMMGLLDFHTFSNSFGMGFVFGAFVVVCFVNINAKTGYARVISLISIIVAIIAALLMHI